MRILIADDDAKALLMVRAHLERFEHEVVVADNGTEALELLNQPGAPSLAILDWNMPGFEGPEVVRRVRAASRSPRPYLMLLTGRSAKADLAAALDSGADDFLTKPFSSEELRARVGVGIRTLGLQAELQERVRELEEALAHNLELQSILPICCYCKKVRNDKNYWEQVENYLLRHSGMRFSHGVCPECFKQYAEPELP